MCMYRIQAFQKDKIEPVKKELEELRRSGQELIQSAASGVSTSDLELDIQTLNNTWSGLNDRVS